MKRQNLRLMLLFLSFLLFPVTLYYFSPYLCIAGALQGVVAGSVLVFAGLFLASLFLGRAFCAYACPAGGMQACLRLVQDKPHRGGWRNLVKYLIWVPWLAFLCWALLRAPSLTVDFLYETGHGVSVAEPMAYVMYYGVLLLVLLPGLLSGRRAFCHLFCWMAPFMVLGRKASGLLRLPSLRLKSAPEQCTGCGSCTRTCPMSLPVAQMAASGKMEHSECILCGACVDGCPKGILRYRFGRKNHP